MYVYIIIYTQYIKLAITDSYIHTIHIYITAESGLFCTVLLMHMLTSVSALGISGVVYSFHGKLES